MTDERLPRRPTVPVRLPPLRRPAFWAVQGLVLLIAVSHTALETVARVNLPEPLYLIPSSLFFIPVVYAALSFGVRGAVPTALWAIAVTLPNIVLLHTGWDRLGVAWQGLVLLTLSVFVGFAVDRERAARDEAEAREAARLASEARYRALFDRASEAVLVVDSSERIEEGNSAAGRLLMRDPSTLPGIALEDALGADIAAALRPGVPRPGPKALPGPAGTTVWVQPVPAVPLGGSGDGGSSQVMLHDVTLQHERQQGLEGWARHAIAAREAERRRMGREIHDGPVQSLVLLSRKLDALGESNDHAAAIEDAREIAGDTAGELRRISRALRPTVLDDLGLTAALRAESTAFARRSGVAATFQVLGDPAPLDPDLELLVLRLVQEALHNVERHARAATADVILEYDGSTVVVEVTDDGVGIGAVPSPTALLAASKLGLVGMQERVRLVDGTLEIAGRPVGGTSVRAELPATASRLADEAAAAAT